MVMPTLYKHNIQVHMFNLEAMRVKLKVQSRVPIPKQPDLMIGTTEYILVLQR